MLLGPAPGTLSSLHCEHTCPASSAALARVSLHFSDVWEPGALSTSPVRRISSSPSPVSPSDRKLKQLELLKLEMARTEIATFANQIGLVPAMNPTCCTRKGAVSHDCHRHRVCKSCSKPTWRTYPPPHGPCLGSGCWASCLALSQTSSHEHDQTTR